MSCNWKEAYLSDIHFMVFKCIIQEYECFLSIAHQLPKTCRVTLALPEGDTAYTFTPPVGYGIVDMQYMAQNWLETKIEELQR